MVGVWLHILPSIMLLQSPECKQVERIQFEFWVRAAIMNQSTNYLKGKTADESPPPQALPSQFAKQLD
jgi:hypothetical protein